jgi:FAD/FMN-containing dehydrogenase
MSDLLGRLAEICGGEGVLTGAEVAARAAGIWRSDGVAAGLLVRPRDTDQVSSVLALCHERGQSVVTHGGLTGLVHGADTAPEDLVLSLERMTAVEELDGANRTLTVQAGAPLQAVQEAAEAEGLLFALDLGARGSCSVGGNVATNAGGTQVIRYGMAREQVLGLEAVLADGTVLSSMNRMLKNNAGYDLKQLFIGSEGTLGVITRLVLRLRERPASRCTALLGCETLDSVIALLRRLDAGLAGQLSSFEVMWQDFYTLVTEHEQGPAAPLGARFSHYVLVEAAGASQREDQARFEEVLAGVLEDGLVADAVVAHSGRERDALWAIREAVEVIHALGPVVTFDVSLRLQDMEAYVDGLRSRLRETWPDCDCWVFGHLGDGNLHILVRTGLDDEATRRRVEALAYKPLAALGGSISAEHGIGLEKKSWLGVSRSDEEVATMRSLKAALDPRGILNPGKIFD